MQLKWDMIKVIKYLKSDGKVIEKDGNGVPVTEYLELFKRL